VILAGCGNRQQQQVIEYLRTENQVIKEKRGERGISALILQFLSQLSKELLHAPRLLVGILRGGY